jgi:hypothetical protein
MLGTWRKEKKEPYNKPTQQTGKRNLTRHEPTAQKSKFCFFANALKKNKMQAHILAHLVALPESKHLATKRAKILLPAILMIIRLHEVTL